MRLIDADALESIKYHPLPYTHIVPDDVDAEAYERGWNDAVDAIVEDAPTIEPDRKTGNWTRISIDKYTRHAQAWYRCSECQGEFIGKWNYCPNCGTDMRGEQDDER